MPEKSTHKRIDENGFVHSPAHDGVDDFCRTCWEEWPCARTMALDATLGGD